MSPGRGGDPLPTATPRGTTGGPPPPVPRPGRGEGQPPVRCPGSAAKRSPGRAPKSGNYANVRAAVPFDLNFLRMSPPRSGARKCLSDTASEPPSSFHPLLLPAAGFASRARRSPNVAKREARGSRARRGATPGTPAPGTVTPGPPTPRTPAPKDPSPGAGMLRDREQPGLRVVMARPGAFPRLVQPTGSCPARGSPPRASARSHGDPKINPAGLRGRAGRRREGEEGSAPHPPLRRQELGPRGTLNSIFCCARYHLSFRFWQPRLTRH